MLEHNPEPILCVSLLLFIHQHSLQLNMSVCEEQLQTQIGIGVSRTIKSHWPVKYQCSKILISPVRYFTYLILITECK